MRYPTPFYIDNREVLFPFAEYGDTQNAFIKLYYWIDREKYRDFATPHGQYPVLDKTMKAENGEIILRTDPQLIASPQAFRLLSERATDRTVAGHPNVLQVEQIYGYAPAVTHPRGEEVDWTQPGYYDRSAQANYSPVPITGVQAVAFMESLGIYRINLSAAPVGLSVGDMVRLRGWRPWNASTVEGEIFTQELPVIAISGTLVDIEAASATSRIYPISGEGIIETSVAPSAAANLGGADLPVGGNVVTTFNRILNGSTWYFYPQFQTTLRLEKLGNRKAPEDMGIGSVVRRTYFYRSAGMPASQPAFRVTRAGQIVNELDINTQPTVSAYQAMVANGTLIRPRNERTGQVMGDVWYKDQWLIPAQLQ